MALFLQTSLSFPVVLLSFLLCVALLYWIVAALGILEVDMLDIEAESSFENDSSASHGLAGLLLKLGLNGVPVTLILTLLVFFSWLLCYYAEILLLRFIPLGWLRYPLGLLAISASLLMSTPLVGLLIRPLRPFFRKLEATNNLSFLGQSVVVRSGKVSSSFGEATLENGGADLILRIRADEKQGFKRGDSLVLIEYLESQNAYRVVSELTFTTL